MNDATHFQLRIVSGGQTGVDRAALDVASELGIPAGDWCPQGRLAEDGIIPKRYPLKELSGGGYPERTLKNVVDSDGTVIICFEAISGGTKLTHKYCVSKSKLHLLIDGTKIDIAEAATLLTGFIQENNIGVLNVAGPRSSNCTKGYKFTYNILTKLIKT
jgi:hypothetical protein